ncbi:GcrA family cell cycle regulator [Lichenihabitans sp. PAMC28606]|uniref:GcrA family cell cycle regulator n=1 Tax=Lichenihabitans sp. PAMC28606 TaxID=2880932 RepID=UPI0029CAB314|nr:GcrA family cell cycle regulator [Lichenihabitans sp. PAMC28606]
MSAVQPGSSASASLPPSSSLSWATYMDSAALAVDVLLPRDCRWPIGDVADPTFRFCSQTRVRGVYCATHWSASRTRAPR